MNLLDYFDVVCVINLPERTDRLAEFKKQINKTRPYCSNITVLQAIKPKSADGFPSVGAHGCYLSHMMALQHAIQINAKSVLILEDDLNFTRDFSEQGSVVADSLKNRIWDMFYGGYVLDREIQKNECITNVEMDVGIQTGHFVAFRGKAIQQVYWYLFKMISREPGSSLGGPMHVDGAYNWFRQSEHSPITLLATPMLGYQRSSKTDISENKWFDKIPVINSASKFIRNIKNIAAT